MGINLPKARPTYLKIVERGLNKYRKLSSPIAVRTLESSRSDALDTALPHEVFLVDLPDFIDGNFLRKARRVGIRYLILDNNEPYAAVHLFFVGKNRKPKFSNVIYGPVIENLVRAVGFSEELAKKQDRDYDLRLLEIPGINFMGLWLHTGKRYKNDLLIPVPGTPGKLVIFPAFTQDELYAENLKMAIKRLDVLLHGDERSPSELQKGL